MSDQENTRRLVLAIIDFLQSQLNTRSDLSLEDREGLEIAIECLILTYDVENTDYNQRRPLMDMFMQVAEPVSIEDRTQAESHKLSGNAKMEQEQYTEADEEYSRAIQLDKWNAVYYCNRASARIKLQQYYEAISDCRQAIAFNPDYAKAYARMGQAYALMNSPRRAARCYRLALEREPDNERYQNNLRVAEGQAAEQPNMDMGHLIQSIFSSLSLGGSPSPGGQVMGGPGTTFMIIGDPHTEDNCPANHSADETRDTLSNSNSTGENQINDDSKNNNDKTTGNENSERRGEDEPLHLRVLFGVPTITPNDDHQSANSKSTKPNIIRQPGVITDDRNQTGEQKSVQKEVQPEIKLKRENTGNMNSNDKTTQEENSKLQENSNSENKSGKKDDKANADNRSPHQNISNDLEKSKNAVKNIMQTSGEGSQNNFKEADSSVANKTKPSVKKDLERQQKNSENFVTDKINQTVIKDHQIERENSWTQTKGNGPASASGSEVVLSKTPDNSLSAKINQPVKKDGEIGSKNSWTQTEKTGHPGTSQRNFSFKSPEGDTKKGPQSSTITMADITSFFRNISRSDREKSNEHKNENKLKQTSNENEKGNDQRKEDNQAQEYASSARKNQSGKLSLPENKPSKEKEKEALQENYAPASDVKQKTDENLKVTKKSNAAEEENKNK